MSPRLKATVRPKTAAGECVRPAVVAVQGGYRVTVKGAVHFVNKQRQCSCTRKNCSAVRAVAAYLQSGGYRAPAANTPQPPHTFPCPLCGAPATGSLEKRRWACTAERLHYHQWWGAQLRALQKERTAWLKQNDPYRHELAVFFQNDEARQVFLAAHALSYAAGA